MTQSQPTDSCVIRLSPEDNVCVAVTTIEAGRSITVEGKTITVTDRIPTSHKLALVSIAAGGKVVKYGAPIGSATCDIHPGQYVHTHNLKSDYLPTYTLDGTNPFLTDD